MAKKPCPVAKGLRPTRNWKRWPDGWLSPRGAFYGCEPQQHIALGIGLGTSYGVMEHLGWLKLQSGLWVKHSPMRLHEWPVGVDWPTQSQIDTVFDRSKALGCFLPEWAGGKEAEDS